MTAINQNYTQHLGDSKDLVFSVFDSDGSPITTFLSGVSASKFVIKQYANSSENKVSKTLGSGITVNSGAGTVTVALSSSDTSSLQPGEYYHELRIQTSSITATIATGTVVFKPSTSIS